jgi:hypothetical protein
MAQAQLRLQSKSARVQRKALLQGTPSNTPVPLCTGNKVKRSKAKQAIARYIANVNRLLQQAQTKGTLQAKHLAQCLLPATTLKQAKAIVKALQTPKMLALQKPYTTPLYVKPTPTPLPIKIGQLPKVFIQAQQQVWHMQSNRYYTLPHNLTGYIVSTNTANNAYVIYVPKRGNTPAYMVQVQHNAVAQQYTIVHSKL